MEANNETTPGLVKVGVFAIGTLIGFAAKLATMNKKKTLTWKEVIAQTFITAASAWVVWFFLKMYHASDTWAYIWAVFVGKFGDHILIWIWETVKYHVQKREKP